jgi:DNA-binding ferritin-like protein
MKQSKTLKSRSKKRNTRKQLHKKSVMVKTFMEILAMIKLYHWKTHSYSQHKATDDLYAKLNENIDKFVETLLGKSNSRIQMLEKKMNMYDLDTKTELRERLFEFREFLVDMNQTFDSKRDSDLLNIRDEILGDVNQFLYLLTFDQP